MSPWAQPLTALSTTHIIAQRQHRGFHGARWKIPNGRAPAPTGAQGDRARGLPTCPSTPRIGGSGWETLPAHLRPLLQARSGTDRGRRFSLRGRSSTVRARPEPTSHSPERHFQAGRGPHTAANLWGCQKNSKDTSEHASGKHSCTKALLFNSKFFSSPGPLWPLGTSCPWTHAASSGAAPRLLAEGWAVLCCPGPRQAESRRRKAKGGDVRAEFLP